ncbi:class E sortase [Streptomyces paludis]|uniref:Class E sortase n=1 Tax=Streptomyces paludis TaxID=2282738 RepID=A0A345I0Z8_9ACTN|nr:class E sortase [Streptomyces paludis]
MPDAGAYEAAVDGFADPLNDPLPLAPAPPLPAQPASPLPAQPLLLPPPVEPGSGRHRGPRKTPPVGAGAPAVSAPAPVVPVQPGPSGPPVPSGPSGPSQEWSGDYYQQYATDAAQAPTQYLPPVPPMPQTRETPPVQRAPRAPGPASAPASAPGPGPASGPPPVAPRPGRAPQPEWSGPPPVPASAVLGQTAPMPVIPAPEARPPAAGPVPGAAPAAAGGRAERRKAAKGGNRGRKRPENERTGSETTAASGAGQGPSYGPDDAGPIAPTGMSAGTGARPLSRIEARRAARALKESPAVIASRAVGELFITFGVLMLLFVTYQLWWTNVAADAYAGKQTNKIQESFTKNRTAGAFAPGQGFAIMHIPKLDVVVPIAEGISKSKVLDRGMVGHYAEGGLKTGMPADKEANFAVAGHRNTHGEPFRYINRLTSGDKIIVETRDAYYTYEMTSILPQTPPSNVSVIQPVPVGSGFTGPGRYITLTTCTPEFTSTYRMIVWGKMVDERPRSKGKPDALVS